MGCSDRSFSFRVVYRCICRGVDIHGVVRMTTEKLYCCHELKVSMSADSQRRVWHKQFCVCKGEVSQMCYKCNPSHHNWDLCDKQQKELEQKVFNDNN